MKLSRFKFIKVIKTKFLSKTCLNMFDWWAAKIYIYNKIKYETICNFKVYSNTFHLSMSMYFTELEKLSLYNCNE